MIDQNLVLFESNPDFADNSRALYDYIVDKTDFKTFWVVKDPAMLGPMRAAGVDCDIENSDRAIAMEQCAHYLVTSSFMFAYNKRPGQIHVSAWHGFGPKTIGFDEDAASESSALRDLKVITTQCDLLTTSSRMSQLMMAGMLSMDPRKVMNSGFPRNDYLFTTDGRKLLEGALGVDFGSSKLIMYLPTMRKGLKAEGGQFDKNIFNYEDYDAAGLDEFLKLNDAYVIAKIHFADDSSFDQGSFELPERVLFLDSLSLGSKLLTIYHVLNAFDLLITDYSSVYVDFLLLNRPIVFSCPDFEEYKKDRGFISDDPRWMMPGAFVKSQSDLLSALGSFFNGVDAAASLRESFMPVIHSHRDAKAAERVVQRMIGVASTHSRDCDKEIGSCFADSNSTLRQYMNLRSKAELFLDYGSGFNSEDVLSIEYTSNCFGSHVCLTFNVPSGVNEVRFDPADDGSFLLKDVSFSFNGTPLIWGALNGSESHSNIVFCGLDPQILVSGFDGSAGELCVNFDRCELGDSADYVSRLMERGRSLSEEPVHSLSGSLSRVFRFGRH